MNYYRAIFQYEGTNYFGFQWQKGIPSVQNDLNLSLKKVLGGHISTMSASRTDTGVHALEQIVKITTDSEIDCDSFPATLNLALPTAIKCLKISPCEKSFKPTSGAEYKEYRYLFTNMLNSGGVEERFIANNPYRLNMELMKASAKEIEGRHNFKNFFSAGSNVKTTIREISHCEITTVNPHDVLSSSLFTLSPEFKECYELRIIGNGFLKQMVRHLMSALWLVGKERLSPEEFLALLNGAEKEKRLWKVASPRGLYLYRIKYPEN